MAAKPSDAFFTVIDDERERESGNTALAGGANRGYVPAMAQYSRSSAPVDINNNNNAPIASQFVSCSPEDSIVNDKGNSIPDSPEIKPNIFVPCSPETPVLQHSNNSTSSREKKKRYVLSG